MRNISKRLANSALGNGTDDVSSDDRRVLETALKA